MMKYFSALLLFFLSNFLSAQKKKDIKNFGIKTVITTETKNNRTINDQKFIYNKKGEIIEEINYDKEGIVKSKKTFKYNEKDDVIEEIEYDAKDEIKEKTQIKYSPSYKKTEELVTNKDNKILKKIIYSFNPNGLKKEKKTYDSLNNLIST